MRLRRTIQSLICLSLCGAMLTACSAEESSEGSSAADITTTTAETTTTVAAATAEERYEAAWYGAKQLYTAVQSSLTDMDVSDIDLTLLEGTYQLKGSDFVDIQKPESVVTKEDAVATLYYWIKHYKSDVTTWDTVVFTADEKGCCVATVVRGLTTDVQTGETTSYYGCFPNFATRENFESFADIEEALAFAKGET